MANKDFSFAEDVDTSLLAGKKGKGM